MSDHSAILAGELAPWPSQEAMATLLRAAGLTVVAGRYSIRVGDCSHFVFQEYAGDLGEPAIEADGESVEAMLREAKLVSDALSRAGVKHRFEIYDGQHAIRGYLHHDWPRDGERKTIAHEIDCPGTLGERVAVRREGKTQTPSRGPEPDREFRATDRTGRGLGSRPVG